MELQEKWVDVEGYEGKYKVSNLGKVKTLDWRETGREKLLKQTLKTQGYYTIWLRKDGLKKEFYVHRLVADAFIPKVEGKTFVNHKDCNKMNNSATNLEWCTNQENIAHAHLNHRYKDKKGIPLIYREKRVKMLDRKTNEIIKVFADVMDARRYIGDGDRNSSHIYSCLLGDRKTHKGYRWEWDL